MRPIPRQRPVPARRVLLVLGLISFGVAAKIAFFDLADREDAADCGLWIGLGALWTVAGLRVPRLHPIRVSRRPRSGRLADPLPLGEWITFSVLLALAGLGVLGMIAMLSHRLLGPGPWLLLLVPALLLALHGRPGRPRRPAPAGTVLLGWLILTPVLLLAALFGLGLLIVASLGPFPS